MDKPEITRPAVCVGFTAFATLLTCAFLGVRFTPYAGVFCFLLGVILLGMRLYRKAPVLLLTALTAAVFFLYYSFCYSQLVSPYAHFAGEKHPVRAVILSEPEKSSGNFYYKARITQITDTNTNTDFTVRLSHGESLYADIGDSVSCTVKFFDYTDKFGLSSKTSRLASDAVLGAYVADYTSISVVSAEKRNFSYYFAQIRHHIDDKIKNVLPRKEAAVLSAMLLGFRDDIPDDLNSDYSRAGATHILVISGMHMAIVSEFMLRLLQHLGLRRRIAASLTIPLVLIFMAVSGFSSSVLRSGITQIIFLFGLSIGRKSDALNSLAISALFILLVKPFWIGNISFLLSFTATLGIITLQTRMTHWLTKQFKTEKANRLAARLFAPVTCSIAAILGSLPVQLYVFGTVNLSSVLTSLLVLSASAWIIRFGLPTALLLCIPGLSALTIPLVLITGLLIRYQNFITLLVAELLPGAAFIPGKYVQGTVLISVLFLLIIFFMRRCKPLPISAFLMASLLFLMGAGAETWFTHGQTKLIVCENAYASCTAVLREGRAVVLKCSGNENAVTDILQTNGADTIELLCFGENEAYFRCAEGLLKTFPAERILLPDSVYLQTEIPTEIYHYGTQLILDEYGKIELSSYGDFLSFSINSNTILCDENGAAYKAASCDIAIVDSTDSRIQGALTILCSDDEAETAASTLAAKEFLLLNEHETVCLYFSPDGTYTIQHG